MKKHFITIFLIIHISAISWWTLPHSFYPLVAEGAQDSMEEKLFRLLSLHNYPRINLLLRSYIDFTGNQQYWDFFAPQTSKNHQYLSVCKSIASRQILGQIECLSKIGFSNLDIHLDEGHSTYRFFGSGRSRYYRLTENLIKLDDQRLLKMFTEYYAKDIHNTNHANTLYLVEHVFELHPELTDLPQSGYRMDNIIWSNP